jgi:hypothetical protein
VNPRSTLARIRAILAKEVIQMRRDRLTFAMIIGIPIIQVVLFGYAINTDPKRLPTGTVLVEHGPVARALMAAMQSSNYFDIESGLSEEQARRGLAAGSLAFVVTVPSGFHADWRAAVKPRSSWRPTPPIPPLPPTQSRRCRKSCGARSPRASSARPPAPPPARKSSCTGSTIRRG